MEQVINLLDVVIWPLTVLIGLLFFRKHIGKILSSLGSIKAGAQGFEMNFIEDKLQDATKLIGIGSSGIISKDGSSIIPKDGSSIIPKDGSSIIPKDGSSIIPKDSKVIPNRTQATSPYQELIELEDAIALKLKKIAEQNGFATSTTSNFALTSDLADNGIIDNHLAQKLKVLIELNTMGLNSPKITHEQVTQMKKLFNNIAL